MILYKGISLETWRHCTLGNTGSDLSTYTLVQLELELELQLLDELELDLKLEYLLELELEPELEVVTLELQLGLIWRGGLSSMLDREALQG